MPKPVCVPCKREMVLTRSGVVQFDALAVGGAYEQYHGDFAKCGGCGAEIVFRYGSASWKHHEGSAARERPDIVVPERIWGLVVKEADPEDQNTPLKSEPLAMGKIIPVYQLAGERMKPNHLFRKADTSLCGEVAWEACTHRARGLFPLDNIKRFSGNLAGNCAKCVQIAEEGEAERG